MNAAEASFNPRARVGRDIDVAPPGQLYIDPFQSTRPRGARQLVNMFNLLFPGFNPRARVGRDR